MDKATGQVIRQHLIDPEICIRCNTCEATCPVGAITHDDRNYVVDADKCKLCMDCISPCPTGSIDNWRQMPRVRAYSVEDQLGWDELPAEVSADDLAMACAASGVEASAPLADVAPGPRRPARATSAAPATGRPGRLGRPRIPSPTCTGQRRPTSRSRPR